jgi:hypothetical protein
MANPPKNVAASVRARLLTLSRERNQPFDLLLTRYVLERLLYRLGSTDYRNRFVFGLDMNRLEPSCAHHLRECSRIVAVRLDGLSLHYALCVPGLDTNDRKSAFRKPLVQPGRTLAGLQSNALQSEAGISQPGN